MATHEGLMLGQKLLDLLLSMPVGGVAELLLDLNMCRQFQMHKNNFREKLM